MLGLVLLSFQGGAIGEGGVGCVYAAGGVFDGVSR